MISDRAHRLAVGVAAALLALGGMTGCAHVGGPYDPGGAGVASAQEGIASWYGKDWHGRLTASGEVFNMYDYTAAHRTLPFQTRVRVTLLSTGRSVVVRINDRGPFVQGRLIDLSMAAARRIGLLDSGLAKVRIEVLKTS